MARWVFTGIGAFYLAVAVAGFAPQAWTFASRGVARPVELHVHAAIMGLFLTVFIAQATLVGRGDVNLHRRLGLFGVVLGAIAGVSMLVVLDSAMRRENLSELPFLTRVLTLGILQVIAFLGLFAAAVVARRHPSWRRRLMAFAVLVTLQAAIQRMSWLPSLPLSSFWANGAWLYVLAIPLIAFDLATLRRLHPATLVGLGAITFFVGLLSVLWQSEAYNAAFLDVWRSIYGS